MIKSRIFCIFLSLLLLVAPLSVSAEVGQVDIADTNGCHSVDAAKMLSPSDKMTDTARAVVMYELNSGTMLYTWNPDAKIYPTSMVKLMTALVALEKGNLDDEVTVTRKVLDELPIGIVSAGLKYNEVISLRDLLYCTMVASANDASIVIANHIAGSTADFVQMMNEKAEQIGCKGTHYSDVNGLHNENTYTTARDICRLIEVALQNEIFREMFETATYTVPATNKSEERKITTTNHMMNEKNKKYYDERVTGDKTGATDEGGRCLALTAEVDDMQILCVVMGAQPTVEEDGTISAHGSFEESKILLDYAFKTYEPRQVFYSGQTVTQYPVVGGAHDVVTQPAASIMTILPRDLDDSQIKWVHQQTSSNITAPVQQGDKLGVIQAWYGDKCLAQTDLVAMNHVPQYQAPIIPEKPQTQGGGDGWVVVLWIIGGIVLVVVLAFLALVFVRNVRVMKHRRRNRRRRDRA